MSGHKIRFGIKIDKLEPFSAWSIGICLSHLYNETYIFINLFFITISIGKLELDK